MYLCGQESGAKLLGEECSHCEETMARMEHNDAMGEGQGKWKEDKEGAKQTKWEWNPLFSLILDMCIVHMIYAYKESGVKKKNWFKN